MEEDCTPWRKGPLPPDTYNWGGVVLADHKGTGFYFADFKGDHAVLVWSGPGGRDRRLEPHEVAWYCNCLCLPPTGAIGREGA